jgi:hypothetical protein
MPPKQTGGVISWAFEWNVSKRRIITVSLLLPFSVIFNSAGENLFVQANIVKMKETFEQEWV